MNTQIEGSCVLLRNIGFVGIAIGLAWLFQVVGFESGSPVDNLAWILAAASIAGAGMGLIVVSRSLNDETVHI